MEKVSGVLVMTRLFLVLIIVPHHILITARKKILVEGRTFDINGTIVSTEKKSLVLTLVKHRQDSARVSITMVMIVTSLLMKKKSLGLKSIMKTLTFQLGFVWEAYLIVDLMLLSLGKYL